MDWICICAAMDWFSSILILANIIFSWNEVAVFSRIGVNCLQGEHQGAQKSTTTGSFSEPLIIYSTKFSWDTSMIFLDIFCDIDSYNDHMFNDNN